VLRVPTAALRFKPDAKLLASLGTPAPEAAAPKTGSRAPAVWVANGGRLAAAAVQVGASDATYTELVSSSLPEGTLVVTRAASSSTTAPKATATAGNPLMPTRPGPPR